MTESTACFSDRMRSFRACMPEETASRRLPSCTAIAALLFVYCCVVMLPASNSPSSAFCTAERSRKALMFSCIVTASLRLSALIEPNAVLLSAIRRW